jgi:hypothetical protein
MRTNFPTREIGREVDYEGVKYRAYVDHGIVIAKLDDPRLSWVDKEELKRIASKIMKPRR